MTLQFDQIYYIVLLGDRDEMPFTNTPPVSITHPMLRYIGNFPQDMYQFVYGWEYYENSLANGLQMGYKMVFLYPDGIQGFDAIPIDENNIMVFLFCTENETLRKHYCSFISKCIGEKTLSIVSEGTKDIGAIPGAVADSAYDVWQWFYDYSWSHYKIENNRSPYSVPYLGDKNFYDLGNAFSPTRVNTQIFNSILGNWGYPQHYTRDEITKEVSNSSNKAFASKFSFDRQNLLLDQIAKIHNLELYIVESIGKIDDFKDQFLPPLIIAAPYNSAEMRKPIDVKGILSLEEKSITETLNAVMNFNYTANYIVDMSLKGTHKVNLALVSAILKKFLEPRMTFFDMVGLLHASIRFSPYMRLPILGKNINSELAFVGIKNVKNLAQSKKANQNIRKVMERIGRKMAATAFSPTCFKMLNKRSSQIVAMTDLPIEWIMNDNIPLAFTHDVCRLPETPIPSLLAQYEEATVTPYTISKDIMKKTLVVFGNTDPEFVKQQQAVLELADELGFVTKTCLTIADLEKTLSEIQPELLIIDAHGDVDEDVNQSYLWLGNEKLTGDVVIDKGLSSRLVFLSACNTFTTGNTISTIANAFFQAGASSVTTSYMPVSIVEATGLYTRLLRMLSEAAITPVHKNWLAFIAHIQRTSYIHALITEAKKDRLSSLDAHDIADLTLLTSRSMNFHDRKGIYKKLSDTNLAKKLGVNYQYVIPHYLMYSTLGRADLIRFECYLNKKHSKLGIKSEDKS